MSVQAIAWVLDHSPTKASERLVLLSIANHADEDGVAWPSIKRIAREANVSTGTVKRVLSVLVSTGQLRREVNAAPDSRIPADRRPNLYRIVFGDGGTKSKRRGAQADTPAGGTTQYPESSEVTIKEPSSEASPPREPTTSKPKKARERNLVWDAVVEVIGWDPADEDSAKRIGRVVKKIREKCPDDATDEQIALAVRGRARRYRNEWPTAELSPEALLKHWERFAPPRGGEKPLEGTAKFFDLDDETRRKGERLHAWHLHQKREAEAKGECPTFTDPPDDWQPPTEAADSPANRPESGGRPRGRRSVPRGSLRRPEGSEEAAS